MSATLPTPAEPAEALEKPTPIAQLNYRVREAETDLTELNTNIGLVNAALGAENTRALGEEAVITAAYIAADVVVTAAYTAEDTAIRSEFAAADAAITTAFTAADAAITTAFTAADNAITAAFTAEDVAIRSEFAAADAAVTAAVTAAFVAADAVVTAAYTAEDTAIRGEFAAADAAITTAFTAADTALGVRIDNLTTTATLLITSNSLYAVETQADDAVTYAVANSGRVVLLDPGTVPREIDNASLNADLTRVFYWTNVADPPAVGAEAANIIFKNGGTYLYTVAPGETVTAVYSGIASKWLVLPGAARITGVQPV